jgi:hypothetical protein
MTPWPSDNLTPRLFSARKRWPGDAVGRLDYNTEAAADQRWRAEAGDGLPSSVFHTYRARTYGDVTQSNELG